MPVTLPMTLDLTGADAGGGAFLTPPAVDYSGVSNLVAHQLRLDYGGDYGVNGWDYGQADLTLTQVFATVLNGGFGLWIADAVTLGFVRFTPTSAEAYTRIAGVYSGQLWAASGPINPDDVVALTINSSARTARLTVNGSAYGATIPFAGLTPTNICGMYTKAGTSAFTRAFGATAAVAPPPSGGPFPSFSDQSMSGGMSAMGT